MYIHDMQLIYQMSTYLILTIHLCCLCMYQLLLLDISGHAQWKAPCGWLVITHCRVLQLLKSPRLGSSCCLHVSCFLIKGENSPDFCVCQICQISRSWLLQEKSIDVPPVVLHQFMFPHAIPTFLGFSVVPVVPVESRQIRLLLRGKAWRPG